MGKSLSHRDFNLLTFFWRLLAGEAIAVTEKNSMFPFTLVLIRNFFGGQAAYSFSFVFQHVINIGLSGSEPIRSRAVQAGTLDVVGCNLKAWLPSKGFAVGPSPSASGLARET